jgi:glycolate oxidase FAD binding subunit
MALTTSSIEQQLASIVGACNLREAAAADAICGVMPKFVAEPDTEQQLAALLAFANEAGLAVIPRGGGTKLDWGNPPHRADLILSTARFNKILEHAWADLTATFEAGCTFQSLQEILARNGQRLAIDPLWPERATVGGILSTNDSGALRLRFGALRDLIIGITLALPDGTLASSGGKVVKNVAGYDLPKLATGALGTLGMITRAVFRLHPLPHRAKTLSFSATSFGSMQDHILRIQDSKLAHTSLQIRAASDLQPGADILFEATDEGLAAQEAQLRQLLGSSSAVPEPSKEPWGSREQLWSNSENAVIAKFTFLPREIVNFSKVLNAVASAPSLRWHFVAQAIGIGVLRLDGLADALRDAVQALRDDREGNRASLVLLHRPAQLTPLDAWGNPGDALPLMRAVEHQLDPKNTLNPGRFVGGI